MKLIILLEQTPYERVKPLILLVVAIVMIWFAYKLIVHVANQRSQNKQDQKR